MDKLTKLVHETGRNVEFTAAGKQLKKLDKKWQALILLPMERPQTFPQEVCQRKARLLWGSSKTWNVLKKLHVIDDPLVSPVEGV